MSDTYSAGRPPSEAKNDTDRLKDAATREASSAREEAERAGRTVKEEASRLAAGAKEKAYESVEEGKSIAAGSLNDFTAAIRKASEELGERDQSMAANLVREAASGLESVSNAIEGQSVQDIARSVAGFARRQPTAFLIGATLAGVALGRFARASSEHDAGDYVGAGGSSYGGSQNNGDRSRMQDKGYGSTSSSHTGTGSSATTKPASTATKTGVAPASSVTGGSTNPPRTTAAATASGVTTTPGSTSTPGTPSSFASPSSHSTTGKPDSVGGGNER